LRVASRVGRAPLCLDAGRTLGPDLVLAGRADHHPHWTTVLDIEERGVADVPPAGVEPVERVGDVVALVVLQGGPPAPPPLTRPGPGPSPPTGTTTFLGVSVRFVGGPPQFGAGYQ
jgi:hypothetical protein